MSWRFVGAAKRAHTASPSSTVAELAHAITVFASTASHMGGGGKRRPAARFFVSFSLCPRRRTRVRSRWLARSHVYLSLSLTHTHTHLLSLAFSLFPSLPLSLSLALSLSSQLLAYLNTRRLRLEFDFHEHVHVTLPPRIGAVGGHAGCVFHADSQVASHG